MLNDFLICIADAEDISVRVNGIYEIFALFQWSLLSMDLYGINPALRKGLSDRSHSQSGPHNDITKVNTSFTVYVSSKLRRLFKTRVKL